MTAVETGCPLYSSFALILALLAGVPALARAQGAERAPAVEDAGSEPPTEAPAVVIPLAEPAPGDVTEPSPPEQAQAQSLASPAPAEPVIVAEAPSIVLAPPAPEPARWAPVFTASAFTRHELRHGYDDLGISRGRFQEGDAFFHRVRLGFNSGPIDVGRTLQVALQVTPQAAGTFGRDGPGTLVDAALGLHEGYLRLQGKRFRLDTGRYEMVYGDALMIGNNDWNEVGRTFDGARARVGERSWLDLFANVVDEGLPAFQGAGAGDLYFLGAYASLGPLAHASLTALNELDVYVLARVWGQARGAEQRRDGARELTFGTRAKGRIGACDYRAETGVQAGTRPGIASSAAVRALAWQGDLEVGYGLLDERLRVALEVLYATGGDPRGGGRSGGWEDLFPSGHKWLGLADAFNQNGQKRTNVASAVLHFTGRIRADLTVQLDGHVFARPRPTFDGGQRGFAGGELDASLVYQIVKGIRVRALYALFLPNGDLYSDSVPDRMRWRDPDPAQYFEAELRYDL